MIIKHIIYWKNREEGAFTPAIWHSAPRDCINICPNGWKLSPVTTTCIYCSSNYTPVALLHNSVIAMQFFPLQSCFFIHKQNVIRLGVTEDHATSSEHRKVPRYQSKRKTLAMSCLEPGPASGARRWLRRQAELRQAEKRRLQAKSWLAPSVFPAKNALSLFIQEFRTYWETVDTVGANVLICGYFNLWIEASLDYHVN